MSRARSPRGSLGNLLREKGLVFLDGGLATTLEANGAVIDDPLWSTVVLLEEPLRVSVAHRAFVEAGADVITTATYQATFQGLMARGLGVKEAADLLLSAVELAREAASTVSADRPVLVASSIGPYGAHLADGSEYRGDYGLSETELCDFHEPQVRVLAEGGADLLAFETIPDASEAAALVALLETIPDVDAWLSFTLRDEAHLADGTPLEELLAELQGRFSGGWSRLVAVGVNCVPPSRLEAALPLFAAASNKPIVAYPNSGECYSTGDDGHERGWSGEPEDWIDRARDWHEAGVRLIGGCCRTTPEDIARLRRAFSPSESSSSGPSLC